MDKGILRKVLMLEGIRIMSPIDFLLKQEVYMNWHQYISSDPAICGGTACVKGTRIPVSVVLDNLAAGLSSDELIKNYPSLTVEAIRAALAYAAEISHERLLAVPV